MVPIEIKEEIKKLAKKYNLKFKLIEMKKSTQGYASSNFDKGFGTITIYADFKKLEFNEKRAILLHEFGHLIFKRKRKSKTEDLIKLPQKTKGMFYNDPLICAKAIGILLDIASEMFADDFAQKLGAGESITPKYETLIMKKLIRKIKNKDKNFQKLLKRKYKKDKEFFWDDVYFYNRLVARAIKHPEWEISEYVDKFFPKKFIRIVRNIVEAVEKEKTILKKVKRSLPHMKEEIEYAYNLISPDN